MGKFGRRLRRAFKKVGKKIADGFTKVFRGIGDFFRDTFRTIVFALDGIRNPWFTIKSLVKGLVRTVANFIRSITDGLIDIVFGVTGAIPSIFGEKAGSWWVDNFSEAIRHVRDLIFEIPMAVIQGVLDFGFGFLEGIGFLVIGRIEESGNRFLKSLKNLGSVIYEVVLILSFKLVMAGQVLFKREDAGDYLVNLLNEEQEDIITGLFEHSINLTIVRYKTGFSGILSRGSSEPDQATTIANTIYFRNSMTDPSTGGLIINMSLVLHELIHVWQFQNGGTDYITRGIRADKKEGDAKYHWWVNLNRTPPTRWENLTIEKQGELIEDAHKVGAFNLSASNFLSVASLPAPGNYTGTIDEFNEYLSEAVEKIQRGIGAP